MACRDLRLNIMKRHMDKDKSVYLKLTSSYSSIANYWKYFIGQTEQLKRLNVVNKKRDAEAKFMSWQRDNNQDATLMPQFSEAFASYKPYAKHAIFYGECFRASGLARMASAMKPLYDAYERNHGKKLSEDTLKKYKAMADGVYKATYKVFDRGTEKEMMTEMTKFFYQNVDKAQMPDIYEKVIFSTYGKSYPKYVDYVFSHTMFTDSNSFNAFWKNPSYEKLKERCGYAVCC